MARKPRFHVRPDGLHEAIRVINGKRKAFRGRSDSEVERKMIAYIGEVEKGRFFKAVADEWDDIHSPTVSHNTLKGYKPALARAMDEFGDERIREIKPPDIKRFLNEFARGGRAKKTVMTQKLVLNLIFNYAVESGDVDFNPCNNVSVPKNLKKTRRDAASLEDEEIIKQNWREWFLPFFVLYTGVRKGEALALQGRDIDFDRQVIHITKSVYHDNNRPVIKSPKTEKGVREIPILAPLADKMKRLPQAKYLFSADGGVTPMTDWQYTKYWKDFQKATGAKCTAHQLRHSFATMLFENDVDARDAQDLLGHTTLAMTQDIYTHIRTARRQSVADKLNKKLSESMNSTQPKLRVLK